MDQKIIASFEQALKDEIEQRKRALDDEFAARLKAFKIACGHTPPVAFAVYRVPDMKGNGDSSNDRPVLNGNPSILKAVKEALRRTEGEFSVRDLVPMINGLYPNLRVQTADLSNPLWTLHADGEIIKVRAGMGKNPHIYRKADDEKK